ncbi:MAG TPA: arylsulfotransferase family protein [Solirubrobacteraceae bacterium]|nr:arylsulfotransferase family protein [Solirubrobacteraceae bacterium]
MPRHRGYIVLLVAAVAWVTVAIILGTGNPSGARSQVPPSGPSPACLPSTLEHSAAVAGVDVSPAPGTGTANPNTQVSFRGIPVTQIGKLTVRGAHSGDHSGHLYGYFQGDGGSFVADKPFRVGEQVSVSALIGPPGSERRASFSFGIADPYPTDTLPQFPNPPAAASSVQSFVSAPNLHPPILNVTAADRDPRAGEVMMTVGPGPGQFGPVIYSPQGRLVWFGQVPPGENALNLSVQPYEGRPSLTWWQGRVFASGFGKGRNLVVDANYQTVASVGAGNGYEADLHDFQIAPHNVAYLTVYNLIRCDLSSVGGVRNGTLVDTAVQEVDMKTGLVRWEWHSADHVATSESHAPVPTNATPWDAFHLNSIDREPNGDLLLSARSTWTTYLLEGATGKIIWRLGGTKSTFTMAPGTETAWQHDARLQPDGTITLFDDGSNPRVHYQSRGLRVRLDTQRHMATAVRVYPHPGNPLVSDSQGNMQTLPSGNLLIGWGSVPSVTELGPAGELLLDAHLPPGYSSYRAFRFPWDGHPIAIPQTRARLLAARDSTAVFASWNGATNVQSWRVLAGATPAALAPRATMPVSGFESSLTLPDPYPYVAVQALGAGGQLLGTSAAVKVEGT